MRKYVLKVDIDIKLPEKWLTHYKLAIGSFFERYTFIKLKDVKIKESSKRGYHIWIHILSSRKLSPEYLNMLQFLCGDDRSRVLINARRIKRGVPWSKGNKLFSKVVYRREKGKTILCEGHSDMKVGPKKYCVVCELYKHRTKEQEALLK